MSERLNDHIHLLLQVRERLSKAQSQDGGIISDEILHQLTQVIDQLKQHTDSGYIQGQDWITHIFNHLPQLSPTIDRDLLWFFGGDCLHFLTDEEINLFQQMDEIEAQHEQEQKPFDRQSTKKILLNSSPGFDA
ncbi:MAG: hypothetical protein LRY66_11015 [Saccharospirillaceae bacterium]|nr:hypothetical protein [Saccharospirillaceae bacterium]MCD8531858.1 hypothetical protein [Saccharospirillaceae bacterium]